MRNKWKKLCCWIPVWGLAVSAVAGETRMVGHFVWHDLNRNGIQDPGEPGINGVNVKLYDANERVLIASQSTSNNGGKDGTFLFRFEGPRKVYLEFELPIGFAFTLANQGHDPARNSDVDPFSGSTAAIDLDSGESPSALHLHCDAGLVHKLFEQGNVELTKYPGE